MGRGLPWIAVFFIVSFTIFSGCGGDKGSDDDSADDAAGDDSGGDDTEVDAVSSASPGKDSNILTGGHAGWGDPACPACHQNAHRGGFANGECVACHGSNGAPTRPDGHATQDCASCHAAAHAGLDFEERHCTACHKFGSGAACPATEDYDVVVIGAGGGGLAAATMLAKAGMKVALLEKHYKVGGYMTTFKRGDYTFEVSLHAMDGLDAPAGAKGAFDLMALGIYDRIQPLKADPMYRSVFPGSGQIAIPADIGEYKAMLKEMYPAEADGIEALFKDIAELDVALAAVEGLQAGFNLDDLLKLLANLPAGLRLLKYMDMTLLDVVQQYVHDPQLIGLWTQLVVFIGGGPSELQGLFFATMWSSYHNRGYYYIMGGSQSVSNAMADVFRENGGTLRLSTLATKIVIENGRAVQVRTQDDACYNARYVVSNANAPDTLLKMIGAEYLPADYVSRLGEMEIGVATFQVFLGVNHDYRGLFQGSHEIMVNESWDQDENFEFIKEGSLQSVPYIIADYTAIDPTNAPEGKNAISLTTYLPYDWRDTWRWEDEYDDYTDLKEEAARVFIERAETYLPGLGDHIEIMEVGSPVTNFAYALNPRGTIFGWSNTPEQATLRRLPMQTPIENVLLAGAWTFPGGGQSAVMSSGMLAAKEVLTKEQARR